jgi:hypothetical protein
MITIPNNNTTVYFPPSPSDREFNQANEGVDVSLPLINLFPDLYIKLPSVHRVFV